MPVAYSTDMFTWEKVKPPTADVGFAGFRLQYPLNRIDYYDEVCAFLGASYFRAVARGQGYGLSARGLAIKTADSSGEEFPLFRSFWLERPSPGADSMTVHALLDSQSAAGAFRFVIRPGQETLFDTEVKLYPRVDIAQAGFAPLTSMFFFGPNNQGLADDWRAAVHDTDGLMLRTGHDERIWRPLINPRKLQISAFSDTSPRGFGLAQRARQFTDCQDLEAVYQKRPTLWIEPCGNWGQGIVELVGATLADCIHHYFRQSEQVEAALKVAVARSAGADGSTRWRGGCLMIQRLPADRAALDREAEDEGWRRAAILMSSSTSRELVDPLLAPETLLFRLFHEDGVRVHAPHPLAARCRCSRRRVESVLRALTPVEIEEMKIDGRIEVTCEFCSTVYAFDAAAIADVRNG